ncbi:MAG TPA: hypothetical protein PLH79_06050 [bacterium]|nr:hypothetical protein [Candidatus Omnitrophota bacterium]HOL93890.1 hypothetical protein [bacterium]HPP00431.1 hypothetical protein [bacterium]
MSVTRQIQRIGILLTVGLILGWEADAGEADFHRVAAQFPDRQIQSLEEIASAVSSASMEVGAALLFLNRDLPRANALLQTFDNRGAGLLQYPVVLRILREYGRREEQLHPPARLHLEKQIAEFILTREIPTLSPMADPDSPESRQILETSLLLLWAQHVAEATPGFVWPNKMANQTLLNQYQNDAHQWLDFRLRHGLEERGSLYTSYTLAALLNLRDFTRDPVLQTKADGVCDFITADLAQESLHGHWGGARLRSFESLGPLPGERLQAIWFGAPLPPGLDGEINTLTLILGHTGYRPPPVLTGLGCDPEARGTYEIKNRYFREMASSGPSRPGIVYSYVTPSYILGSFYLRDEPVPWQSRPWDLLVTDAEGMGHHFFTFTGDQLFSGRRPPLSGEYYLWNSTCLQYQNVLFCQFHRSDRKRADSGKNVNRIDLRHVLQPTRVWIPDSFAAVSEEASWWFARMENVFLAFRPVTGHSYWWRTAESRQPFVDNASILSFQDLATGFLLEVEDAAHFASFEQFKSDVQQSPLEIDSDSITYVSRRGDVFLFPLNGGDFLVNGRVVDPPQDPAFQLYASPFIQSQYGSGLFKAEWRGSSLTLDFQDPKHPQRIMEP